MNGEKMIDKCLQASKYFDSWEIADEIEFVWNSKLLFPKAASKLNGLNKADFKI